MKVIWRLESSALEVFHTRNDRWPALGPSLAEEWDSFVWVSASGEKLRSTSLSYLLASPLLTARISSPREVTLALGCANLEKQDTDAVVSQTARFTPLGLVGDGTSKDFGRLWRSLVRFEQRGLATLFN